MRTIDLGVVIALKEEFRIFVSEIGDLRSEKDPDTGRYYYFFKWPKAGGYRCAATIVGEMGPEAAALATHDFLKKWKPGVIFMLGIAGGIHEEVSIGDVIFADQVDGYHESGKFADSGIQFAGEVYRCPADLVRDIDNIEFANEVDFNQWREDCAADLSRLLSSETIDELVKHDILRQKVSLQKGHIASGPFVVVSKNFKKKLKTRDRSIKAVEMEAAGVMKAVYQRIENTKAIILRGISDHGDANKKTLDNIGKGALRQYAMRNAVRLFKTLLQLNLIPKNRTKPKPDPDLRISTAKLPTTDQDLFGRENELNLLDESWHDPNINILTLAAFGGVGKTALVNRWLNQMGQNGFEGAKCVYEWSFYSQGAREGTQASADEFFAHTLKWFGDPDPSAGSPWERGVRLAEKIRERRTLLILDGLEPLQYPPGPMQGRLKDQGLQALMRELRRHNPGLCVITTRVPVEDLADAVNITVRQVDLENLSEEPGAQLLENLGVKGTADELKQTVKDFGGHALALNLLGRFLAAHDGDIRKRDSIADLTEEVKHGGHARRVMVSYDTWLVGTPEHDIIRLMGLFDRPAGGGAIGALRKPPAIAGLTDTLENLSETKWRFAIQHLRGLGLLSPKNESNQSTLDCHPLVREHYTEKLRNEKPDAWKEAHSRLYEYFKNLPEKELPDTLEEMEPLFAAMAHGCMAKMYEEAYYFVYFKRIRRGNSYFLFRQLGAFGSLLSVLSNFFDSPWSITAKEISDSTKAIVLNNAAATLRAVGRLRESVQPFEASLQLNEKNKNWRESANDFSNLSQLFLMLGDVKNAVKFGRHGIESADRSDHWEMKVICRPDTADALHQQGNLTESEYLFQEAEAIQKELQPEYPYLYSQRGCRYCDLLLTKGQYAEVRKRAKNALEIALRYRWLLQIGLDNLSMGRSILFQTVSEGTNDFKEATGYLNKSVEGLRVAGQQQELPRGLLARAELHRILRDFAKAQTDLEEVKELAERSEMKLFLTDYHLETARLILDQLAESGEQLSDVEIPKLREEMETHVREAGRLIEETGYFRRKGELDELKHMDISELASGVSRLSKDSDMPRQYLARESDPRVLANVLQALKQYGQIDFAQLSQIVKERLRGSGASFKKDKAKTIGKEFEFLNWVKIEEDAWRLTAEGNNLAQRLSENDIESFLHILIEAHEKKAGQVVSRLLKRMFELNPGEQGAIIIPQLANDSQIDLHTVYTDLKPLLVNELQRWNQEVQRKLSGFTSLDIDESADSILTRSLAKWAGLSPGRRRSQMSAAISDRFLDAMFKEIMPPADVKIWQNRLDWAGITHTARKLPQTPGQIWFPAGDFGRKEAHFTPMESLERADQKFIRRTPSGTDFLKRFGEALYESYVQTQLVERVEYVSLLAVRDIVCFHFRISHAVFESCLQDLFVRSISGAMPFKLSLEVDITPRELRQLGRNRPVIIDNTPRYIIAMRKRK